MNVFRVVLFSFFVSTMARADAGGGPRICAQFFDLKTHYLQLSRETIVNMIRQRFRNARSSVPLDIAHTRVIAPNAPLYGFTDYQIRDESEKDEFISATKYAYFLLRRSSEKLLFMPRYQRVNVPGFDGIIYDQEGNPVANFSLKKSITDWREQLHVAVNKARYYSMYSGAWFAAVSDHAFADSSVYRVEESAFNEQFAKTIDLLKLYGIPSCVRCDQVRPVRIVIDMPIMRRSSLKGPDFQHLHTVLRENADIIESIILILPDRSVVIGHDRSGEIPHPPL